MKIVTIVGARPQFIKAAIVSKQIKKINQIDEILIHTGQHYDQNMSQIFFDQLNIPQSKYNLEINKFHHGKMTGLMLSEIEKILLIEQPKGVLVYGDTNSTLAASLAAAKLNIPVFHIEAGLRSYNRSMPEEINRVLTDHISSLLFCPSKNSVSILSKEGINKGVFLTGDVMYDLFLLENKSIEKINKEYVLATIHRQENTEDPKKLKAIIDGLEKINTKIKVFLPLHPRTEKKIKEYKLSPTFTLLQPISYKKMLNYIANSKLVITDSGGLQKEAFFAKKKCITIRDETEWVELIQNEVNVLCETSKDAIFLAFNKMLERNCDFSQNLYGNGDASIKIVNKIMEFLNNQ